MKIDKVLVSEECDGFCILFYDAKGKQVGRYRFDQEEDKKKLVEVFEALGFKADYEESY